MARQRLELVTCDRCKRQELQPITDLPKKAPMLDVSFGAQKLTFNDLCARCLVTCTNYFEGLKEWERELAPLLEPPIDGSRAPPLQTAPDYSPPKPHSIAATKK
jgi:hypothetical protein